MSKDSVVNFLTPTKLVHGSIKNKPRINLQESQQSSSSQRNRRDMNISDAPSYSFNTQFDQLNKDMERSRDKEVVFVEKMEKSRPPSDRHYVLNNTSKTVLKSQDNYRFNYEQKNTDGIVDNGKPAFNLQPVEYTNQQPPVEQFLSRVKNSTKNSRVDELSRADKDRERSIKDREDYGQSSVVEDKSMLKWQGSLDDLNKLMMALRNVKDTIDIELSELQSLLDNTSRYLTDINDEYLRIKQRIMDYTSNVLDASFSKYKESMINWTKYEEVEKRTIVILTQLQKTIREDQIIVGELVRSSKGPRVAIGKVQELEEKIQFYGNYTDEVRASKAECVGMRPQLRKDKVHQFEKALSSLAQF